MITTKHKLIILWFLLLIGMMLHFNYHVSGIFYGIDVKKPNADGTVPSSLLIIRTLFYHLPMIYILLLVYMKKRWFVVSMFLLSIVYALANLMHFVNEVRDFHDFSQVMLLFMVFVFSLFLIKEHYNWQKTYKSE